MGNPQSNKSSNTLKMLFGVLVSAFALWWTLRSVEMSKIGEALSEVDVSYLFLATLVTIVSYLLRSVRWPVFFAEKTLSFRDSFRCLIVGFFMNNTLPARMGELVRAHLGGKATGQSRSLVLATIAGERLADGIAISLLFGFLFTFFSGEIESTQSKNIFLVALFFLAAGFATAFMLFIRERIFKVLESVGNIMPGHLSQYTLKRIRKFIEGLEPMLEPKRIVVISLWSAVVWSVELMVYILVAKAFGQDLPLGVAGFFLAVVNFSSLIPAAPGGIGVIEALTTAALVSVGINREIALSMVAVQHLIQIAVVGVPGAYYFFLQMRGKVPESIDEIDEEEVNSVNIVSDDDVEPESSSTDSLTEGSTLDLSIVIPAYNEEDRLPQYLLTVLEYLDNRDLNYEVLVVDDGSSDDTCKVVNRMERLSSSVKLLTYPTNRGKGYAVRFGVHNAAGRLILFSDADGATPIGELERLEEALESGSQVAIGSRALYSRDTTTTTVWYRKFMGRAFNGMVNFLILPGIADTQCGFKLFYFSVAKDLFSRQKADGFSFDVEILFLARRAGYQIAEVPVNWTNIPGSKVDLVKDSIKMALDILKFRAKGLVGGYKKKSEAPT